jgi:succinate-semialdehyde dehydrogenase/glutarate-semialdehyde dehydrogenase
MTSTLQPPTTVDDPRVAGLADLITVGAGQRESMEIENPATGATFATVPRCTTEDVAAAVRRGREAQRAWRATSYAERSRILLRFHDLVLQHRDEILDIVQLESGKARRHAFEEIMDVALVSRYYARTAAKHLRPHRRWGAIPLLTSTHEHHHPVGVVGVIAPWNYPLTLSISDATPALAAGNAVVMKTDSQTPFSALIGVKLFREAGLPADLLQVVTGAGSELGPELIGKVDYVMFTGSTSVGRGVAQQAAERLIPSSMELGGKNVMIVLDDANVEKTIEGAVRAMFSNGGQLCISAERLFVHERIADEFIPKLVERVKTMKIGASFDFSYEMGSLVSQKQFDTVVKHVTDAVEKGATVLAGGKPRPELGPYFYEPTLLDDVRDGMTLFADETFGPVVAISRFSSDDEAVARANESDFGLNFSVWTRDVGRGQSMGTRLEAGTVNINEGYIAAWGSIDAPMGGMKDSGVGRRHGAEGIKKYTESQTIAVQRLMPIAPPKGVPPALWAKAMTIGLKLLRRIPGMR